MSEAVKKQKFKFTKLESSWILYDIGNSAFTMMVSTIIPLWFYSLASEVGIASHIYVAYWSYATSIATVIVAILGPICGTIADNKGFKKPMFTGALIIGAVMCASMGLANSWIAYLVIYVIAKSAYSASLVFYDAMLTDVTTPNRMDIVSSQGYAWGYIGSCIPFGAALVIYLMGPSMGLTGQQAIIIDFLIIALWWVGITIPLLKGYKQKYYVESHGKGAIKESFKRLGHTLSKMFKEEKKVFYFLVAFFLYIDGVYTIIDEAVVIGTALGLDTTGLLIALLVTQVIAFGFALIFGQLAKKFDSITLISVCIGGYTFVAIFALFLTNLVQFWIMAFVVGMFQGAIQALSRSYYAKIIPAKNAGEYFGLFDICGKGAAFMGTTLMGVATQLTKSVNIGVATLGVLFVLGFLMLRKSARTPATDKVAQ